MAYIKIIEHSEATGKLKEVYEKIISERSKLSNIMKIHSLHPDSMEKHMELYLSIMFTKLGLKRADRELIAVVVSAANKCDYCINHHAEALNFYWKDDEKIKKLINDYHSVELKSEIIPVLDYAIKLTTTPSEVNEEDINKLKQAGYSDENILLINLIISYFNFVNRIALGLGVDFSPEELTGYKY